ncbi:MAG: hypothetical protein ACYC64_02415 [Armatimonadota bacterium]
MFKFLFAKGAGDVIAGAFAFLRAKITLSGDAAALESGLRECKHRKLPSPPKNELIR